MSFTLENLERNLDQFLKFTIANSLFDSDVTAFLCRIAHLTLLLGSSRESSEARVTKELELPNCAYWTLAHC